MNGLWLLVIAGVGFLLMIALELWYTRWKPPIDKDDDNGKYGM